MQGIRIAQSAWPVIEARLAMGHAGVVPIGAASKEHGRHLPLDTDFRQAEWIANQVLERFPVVVWPTVAYGYYPVFTEYPGSISLSEATFSALMAEVLHGVRNAGAAQIILLNTGISTIAPLAALIDASSDGVPCRLVNVYEGPEFNRVAAQVSEQTFGGHADEIETSIMLAIAPDRVDMSAAKPAPARIVRGMFNRHDPAGPNYSPDGVNGDPTLATVDKGRRLLDAMVHDVEAVLSALLGKL